MGLSKFILSLAAIMVWVQSSAQAQALHAELKVIDVRRNIPLSDTEPTYKDFYINGGTKEGLKPNLIVTAVRKTTIRDAAGLLSLGEIGIPVGQLRIIFVQDGLAVAREHKLLSREELPMLEQIGIMGGDVLDLKGSYVEKRKPSALQAALLTSSSLVGSPASSPTAAMAAKPEEPAIALPNKGPDQGPETTATAPLEYTQPSL